MRWPLSSDDDMEKVGGSNLTRGIVFLAHFDVVEVNQKNRKGERESLKHSVEGRGRVVSHPQQKETQEDEFW